MRLCLPFPPPRFSPSLSPPLCPSFRTSVILSPEPCAHLHIRSITPRLASQPSPRPPKVPQAHSRRSSPPDQHSWKSAENGTGQRDAMDSRGVPEPSSPVQGEIQQCQLRGQLILNRRMTMRGRPYLCAEGGKAGSGCSPASNDDLL